jgi:ABC-type transport system involved in multi-copper enzyme maturation permease subunit
VSQPSLIHRSQRRLRRDLGEVINPRNWREAVIALLLAASATALVVQRAYLSLSLQITLWIIWSLACVCVLGFGWVRLCGPLLLYDLVRIARRRRYLLIRCVYGLGLLSLLAAIYTYWTWHMPRGMNPAPRELTRFAETFFFTFMCAEFVAVLLLTPAYTAGAVAEERDRGTLEFLLATDLTRREIILSKLIARLANLVLLLLVGLPVLSFTQFFGGIDPNLVLTGFAVLGLTLLSLASLSILHSVYASKARTAIVVTYISTAIYLGIGFLADEYLPQAPVVAVWGFDFDWEGRSYFVTVQSLVDAINTGNLIVALRKLVNAWSLNVALTAVLPAMVAKYAIFHGLIFLICTTWSVVRLRSVAASPEFVMRASRLHCAAGTAAPQHSRLANRRWPRLDGNALLWKELVVEPGFHLGRKTRLIVLALAIGSFVPALHAYLDYSAKVAELPPEPPAADVGDALSPPPLPGEIEAEQNRRARANEHLKTFRSDIQDWLKNVGTLIACLTIVAVGIRAAGSISGERDRQTLDNLLTTPLNRDVILYTKWLAALLSVRWTWLWLGLIWIVGLVSGGLSFYALPLLVWGWIVYALFAANLGLWFSTRPGTTLRATMATLLTLLLVGFGHWLLMGCYLPFFLFSVGRRDDFPEWLLIFQKYGLTPPLTLRALAFQMDDLRKSATIGTVRMSESLGMLVGSLAGLICYGVAASILWKMASSRFRTLGVAQPLHQGIFPVHDNPFMTSAATEAATADAPVAEASATATVGEQVTASPENSPIHQE